MPENTDPANGGQGAQGGAGAGQGGAGSADAGSQEPKKLEFTQEEFDRIIADRVSRAKPKDYDDLVKLRDAQAAAAEKEKTDLQKAQDAQKAAETAAQAATARANQMLVRAAIITEAAAQNAADAEVVVALLAGGDSITVEDDGSIKGAKQAVKKLLEEKPFLVKGKSPAANGGEFGGNDQKTLQARIAEAEGRKDWATARRLKLEGLMAQG